jgi:hypothetical protein
MVTESSALDAGSGAALDPAQLMRIEATHRGYGYQHLYAVACLLTMEESGGERLVIEYDEDIEIVRAASRVYVQVKTRNRPLRYSDLHGVLPRFAALRQEHAEGRRSGAAMFVIVGNTEPGPELRARMEQPTWPADVVLLWPECPDVEAGLQIPTPWSDISAALQACIAKAGLIPFPSLAAETLVLKLIGLVQYLATGRAGHAVTRAQVRDFFEQLVVELHDFPEPPPTYRPQTGQPDLEARDRVQLVVGVSGSGKTAWASHAAVLHPSPLAYFDVGELPGSALATSLARELAARFLARSAAGVGDETLPAGSGLELLALLSSRLHDAGLNVTVVLDNVHRVSAAALRSVVEAAAHVRFVLLSQPWPGQVEIEAQLSIQAQTLGGWSSDTVAGAFAAAGVSLTARNAQRVLSLTEGAPLYVNNAARLAAQTYSGDVDRFLNAVEQRLALVSTAQEVILAETFKQLTPPARIAAALLDLSDVPLEHDEALELISAVGGSPTSAASTIRELARAGVVRLFQGGGIKLHDAFRLLARDCRTALPQASLDAGREALAVMLLRTLHTRWTVGRFGLWVRLLPQTNRLDTLIDVATHEQFHQVGDPRELKATVDSATQSPTLSDEDRFWALDALVLWEYTEDAYGRIPELVGQMAALAGSNASAHTHVALAMKQMLAAAIANDRDGIRSAYAAGMRPTQDNPSHERILRYNRALAYYQVGAYEDAASDARQLVMDYYAHLGLDTKDVLGRTAAHILATVPDAPNRDDDLRHTGDCLDLLAMSQKQLGQPQAGISYLHALKFFSAASAWRSAARAGQEAADELVAIGDPHGARQLCETLVLPIVTTYELSDLLLPVRAQYAVILARCGEVDAAREEMSRLESYAAVTERAATELAAQRVLIERIAAHGQGLVDVPYEGLA